MAHAIQSLTDLDNRATLTRQSHVDRKDQCVRSHFQSRDFEWSVKRSGRVSVLPFVRQFYAEPSYFKTDDYGVTYSIHQGEGGEQADTLMPMLYSSGQHGLRNRSRTLGKTIEHLFACLDDLYVICSPERVDPPSSRSSLKRWRTTRGSKSIWAKNNDQHATFNKPLLSERTRTPESGPRTSNGT